MAISTTNHRQTSFVDELLLEQNRLTAVEQFSRWQNANGARSPDGPYQKLIPLSVPRPGEQYAFEVNLDKCSGCKACVTACHSLNGLDEVETWRSVGLLISNSEVRASQRSAAIPQSMRIRRSPETPPRLRFGTHLTFGVRTSDFNNTSPPPAITASIPAV
jgi:NAD-dependent dihydropyrimidine dehydrogenase PreA subunit